MSTHAGPALFGQLPHFPDPAFDGPVRAAAAASTRLSKRARRGPAGRGSGEPRPVSPAAPHAAPSGLCNRGALPGSAAAGSHRSASQDRSARYPQPAHGASRRTSGTATRRKNGPPAGADRERRRRPATPPVPPPCGPEPRLGSRAAPGQTSAVVGDHSGEARETRQHGRPGDAAGADSRFENDGGHTLPREAALALPVRSRFDIVEPLSVHLYPAAGRGETPAVNPFAGKLIEQAQEKDRPKKRDREKEGRENPVHKHYLRRTGRR